MKRIMITLVTLVIFAASSLFAQSNSPLTVGLVGTHFHNYQSDNRLTEITNPYGIGAVVGYQLNQDFGLGLTVEYFNGDMERYAGTETDYRAHLSAFAFPIRIYNARPYLSAGIVFTRQKQDFDNGQEKTDNWFNGRMGVGVDYPVLPNVSLNVDFGFYSNGWDFVGWASTVGIRFGL